jgi:hypothetical protein
MPPPARKSGISRRSWLLAGLATPLFRLRADAQSSSLATVFDGDTLRPVTPGFHFLAGKQLDRLRYGHTVVFLSKLTLYEDDHATVFRQSAQRFYVSCDLWDDEHFRVTIPGANPEAMNGLTAAHAESWCLDNISISALGMVPDRPFWLRFDLRTADPKELSSVVGDTGISLTSLIEFFSRRPGPGQPQWGFETRLRLADLHRSPSRGIRNE